MEFDYKPNEGKAARERKTALGYARMSSAHRFLAMAYETDDKEKADSYRQSAEAYFDEAEELFRRGFGAESVTLERGTRDA